MRASVDTIGDPHDPTCGQVAALLVSAPAGAIASALVVNVIAWHALPYNTSTVLWGVPVVVGGLCEQG